MAMRQHLKRRILPWGLAVILASASFVLGLPNMALAQSTQVTSSHTEFFDYGVGFPTGLTPRFANTMGLSWLFPVRQRLTAEAFRVFHHLPRTALWLIPRQTDSAALAAEL